MSTEITPIQLPLPLNISEVNCYLIKNENGFFLVDSGFTNSHRKLEKELERLECRPGDLKLIFLTHGDFDHIGNAVYLRRRYGAQIAMHAGDAGMLENGDMFSNRKVDNKIMKGIMGSLVRLKAENQGTPDILLEDGASLQAYGLEGTVYNTPGHSTGSICILLDSGDLFCGDQFSNSTGKPMLNPMMYDREAGESSFERLKPLPIQMVYPGHGKPFSWAVLDPQA